jgi:hypothetical protein
VSIELVRDCARRYVRSPVLGSMSKIAMTDIKILHSVMTSMSLDTPSDD